MMMIKKVDRGDDDQNDDKKTGRKMMLKKKSKPGATPVGLRPPSVAPGTFHGGFDLS